MFFEWQRQLEEKLVSAIDPQPALKLMGEFDGFSGIATMAGQWGQRDRVCAQDDSVIGVDEALILQAEAAGQIEATGQAAKVANRIGGGTGEALIVVGPEGRTALAWAKVVARARRSSLTRRS